MSDEALKKLYPHTSQTVWDKAQSIKLVLFDVDGVFSDGRIYLGNHGEELKAFHTRDGYGIKALLAANISVAVITGRKSELVAHRMAQLGVPYIYQGCSNKLEPYAQLISALNISHSHVAYLGDDLVDLPVMQTCGLSAAVNDAHPWLRQHAQFITQSKGGFGAVRELCDVILISQGLFFSAQGMSV
jgi:3-deoxy-D-manno-octulosonate 8-phosphate phosphatase (KDO 8-P phosphatase)